MKLEVCMQVVNMRDVMRAHNLSDGMLTNGSWMKALVVDQLEMMSKTAMKTTAYSSSDTLLSNAKNKLVGLCKKMEMRLQKQNCTVAGRWSIAKGPSSS